MLNIGIAGFGFMGRMHYRCWKALDGVRVAAICDANQQSLAPAAKPRGNIPGAAEEVDFSGMAVYGDCAEMLRREDLDAVSITVPTYLHAECTIVALEAGCHVLCEKPMALDPADASRMITRAGQCGRILQIGHCIRFWPEYEKAQEIVASRLYGRVVAATFQRLAATAARQPGSWFTDESRSGGMPLDLHIHDTDFIQYLFGPPRAVYSSAPGEGLAHMVTRYDYGDGKVVTAEGGWAMMPSFGFQMRFHIALERATIVFDSLRKPALQLCPADGEAMSPPCAAGDGYSRQIAHFVRRIAGQYVPPVVNLNQAWNSLRIVLAERESARAGRQVALEGLRDGRCGDAV